MKRFSYLLPLMTLGFLLGASETSEAGRGAPQEAVFACIANVRTTAYSKGPVHNGVYGNRNALGQPLREGRIRSAAADWSRWPVGTRFRVVESGQEYIIDDIGSAMVGTGTIDLFKPDEQGVRRWGVRHVTIEIVEWGCPSKSLEILSQRTRFQHVRRMVEHLQVQQGV
jgi:3D (Asp-Asp-Asp) domain-containing protein